MINFALLQKLCNAYGVSGNESEVSNIILSEIAPYADNVKIDALGNIIAFKKGIKQSEKKLMLSAHMDEVGFIINFITEDGLLKFAPVGGVDTSVLCGKTVVVGENHIPGVIGVIPVHLLDKEARQKNVPIDDLYIDIGVDSKKDAEKYVSLGDYASFSANYSLEHNMIKSKALDDRIGCFILVNLIKQELLYDTYFTFVVQEEIGLRGAKVAAYTVNPDIAIIVESTTAADIKETPEEKQVCKLKKGTVLSFMDKLTIYDKDLYKLALRVAKENNINVQIKKAISGGNDAGIIHSTRSGVRTLALSLPCRYLHSPCSMISCDDVISTYQLAEKLVKIIPEE